MRRFMRMRRNASLSAATEKPLSADTLIIACDEVQVFPDFEQTPTLGSKVIIQTPANTVDEVSPVIVALQEQRNLKHIVVRAHANCGYVKSLIRGDLAAQTGDWSHSRALVNDARLQDAYANLPVDQRLALYIQHHVVEQLNQLHRVPSVREAIAEGQLKLLGWIYDHEMDWIAILDPDTGLFLPINTCSAMIDHHRQSNAAVKNQKRRMLGHRTSAFTWTRRCQ